MDERQESIAIADRPRDYAGLLWIFLASALGLSLFCATSAIALSDPTLPTPIVIAPGDVADLAFSSLNTAAAFTAEAFQELIQTATPSATNTSTTTFTATPTASFTASPFYTRLIPSKTPTKEKEPRATIILPTATRTPKPTNTAIIINPITGTPTAQEQPTDTPVPAPSTTPSPSATPPPTPTPPPTSTLPPTPTPPPTSTPSPVNTP
ncbi:MAG: hypothetical protein IT313_09115 [Anaerolineales bacterium]|nr:hypothetical protein [Anaerolineales bacterium]